MQGGKVQKNKHSLLFIGKYRVVKKVVELKMYVI
jgi:hypothetical protein